MEVGSSDARNSTREHLGDLRDRTQGKTNLLKRSKKRQRSRRIIHSCFIIICPCAQPVADDIIKMSAKMLQVGLAQDFISRTLKKIVFTIGPYLIPFIPLGNNPIHMVRWSENRPKQYTSTSPNLFNLSISLSACLSLSLSPALTIALDPVS